MTAFRAAGERYLTEHDGITTLSCFATGPHYDPANLSFGPVLAVDEHRLAPGAGFAEHAHRGVVIATWVLAGTLRHSGGGADRLVGPGEVFVQDATDGIRHSEVNASATRPLRFVQTTWAAGSGARFSVIDAPARLSGPAHLYVAAGEVAVVGRWLEAGDSVRAVEAVGIEGSGTVLAVTW